MRNIHARIARKSFTCANITVKEILAGRNKEIYHEEMYCFGYLLKSEEICKLCVYLTLYSTSALVKVILGWWLDNLCCAMSFSPDPCQATV